ncbi:ternary complex factor MIP1, leucine-zipper [Artemisia annua]|uniref:Ternary complex factor MIP1, leucine-zipper n=1 Tax=Artemisia annua TaxID=35608 RepID=A0A2U1PYK3_ARTAN|nr:ternary complex factor MIP1, leucine-zipper [Artemisia annua]
MNSKVKANLQSIKTSLKDSKKKVDKKMQAKLEKTSTNKGCAEKDRTMALEEDIEELRKQLAHEESVRTALEQALNRPLGTLPRLPPYLPPETSEFISEVVVLEEEVFRLEEQVTQCRQDLYEEAIHISFFKKNLENSSHFQEKDPTRDSKTTNATMNKLKYPNLKLQIAETISKRYQIDYCSTDTCLDSRKQQFEDVGRTTFAIQEKGILGDDSPNKISESILKSLMFIFARMSSNSALKMTEMLPSLESCENPWAMDFKDPYNIFYEFENTDIGPYKYLYEIEATTINRDRTTISVFLAQRLKILLGKLALVNLTSLTHQEKLAFWINIYNSCMMNAFLEHGIPETPEKVVQLMQEAEIDVGGHLLNAFSIEHFILRLPFHMKYTFTKDIKDDEVTAGSVFGLEFSEPLVTFALSCGSWSSPAVKVYTGPEVVNELEVAKRDYLQAAVGISATKKLLAIPKLLDWYMFDFAEDAKNFLDWVCLQLPSEVSKVAMKCLERKTSESLSDYVRVIPYEFHFRYLMYK